MMVKYDLKMYEGKYELETSQVNEIFVWIKI